jgi:hypothetical protein
MRLKNFRPGPGLPSTNKAPPALKKNSHFFRPILSVAVFVGLGAASGCSPTPFSIYDGLGETEDGVLSVDIPDEETSEEEAGLEDEAEVVSEAPGSESEIEAMNSGLTQAERSIVKRNYGSRWTSFGFVVVDAKSGLVRRAYRADERRRLASVTKIATAITALENQQSVDVASIGRMLKTSHNGRASQFLRQTVRQRWGVMTSGSGYSAAASCPGSAVRRERPAAKIMLDWIVSRRPSLDWSGASLNDGAGCDYDNFMSPRQVASILRYADSRGRAWRGASFERLLSISGVDGTWRGRNTEHRGRVLAKTGTLSPNSNLAGYFYARRGGELHKYDFVILVEKSGAGETQRARRFIESMVRHWITHYSKSES